MAGARGRDVIAITSVGGRILESSVVLPASIDVSMRTAFMAMTALPKQGTPANIPVSGLPLSLYLPTAYR